MLAHSAREILLVVPDADASEGCSAAPRYRSSWLLLRVEGKTERRCGSSSEHRSEEQKVLWVFEEHLLEEQKVLWVFEEHLLEEQKALWVFKEHLLEDQKALWVLKEHLFEEQNGAVGSQGASP